MNVAVLTLTRDRLDYTKHCFETLHQHAGIPFDHFVLDQGSQDGTPDWLRNEYAPKWVELLPGNIGITRALNILLDKATGYDAVVKFDNDCELIVPGTLKACVEAALSDGKTITSPHIQGLNSPPAVGEPEEHAGFRVGFLGQIGGIFMAVPAWVYDTYRYNPDNPIWGMDDADLCKWFREQAGRVCYLLDFPANHYLTTAGQQADNVEGYYTRKELEFYGR